ncbi:MAG: patatin-like phospholipase family protein [Undibacterium curvum]|uniref:patatin-like phospholipase family protein n=1 Tax=Undibacterium curvum TaxID=2762294 RepID=UPI003BC60225
MSSSIQIFAGQTAYRHIRQHGLQAADIAVIPAAAGGPKGLILQAMDQWLFGDWLAAAPRERSLIGASIGSWRMAAAACADPAAAFARLGDLYCEQTYPDKPSAEYVTTEIQGMLQRFIGGYEQEILQHPYQRLHILINRGQRGLSAPANMKAAKAGFVAAALANLRGREHLAKHLERVVMSDSRDALHWLKTPFDAFSSQFCALSSTNLQSALLASGTLPLIMQEVRAVAQAPAGYYWDGGIIDYHLAFPYSRLLSNTRSELVLYPHFSDQIIPGWLDKALPWRRAARGHFAPWLDNVVMIAPSRDFIRSLPRAKLPDRKDFAYYGLQHAQRISQWRLAIGESQRMRDDLAAFIARPDMRAVRLF